MGSTKKVLIKDTPCYYIPITELLENLMKTPHYEQAFKKTWHCDHSKYTDYCCGEKFKHIINSKCIVMAIYSDDIEITNPIGMKRGRRGKFTVFYLTFLNIPPEERSKLKNIFLLAIGETRV